MVLGLGEQDGARLASIPGMWDLWGLTYSTDACLGTQSHQGEKSKMGDATIIGCHHCLIRSDDHFPYSTNFKKWVPFMHLEKQWWKRECFRKSWKLPFSCVFVGFVCDFVQSFCMHRERQLEILSFCIFFSQPSSFFVFIYVEYFCAKDM